MDAVLLTESLSPDRRTYKFGDALPFSTMGSSLLKFTASTRSYSYDASAAVEAARSVGAKVFVIGTDADVTGTLIASVARKELVKAGFKCIRHLYTAEGYVAFGGFMNDTQIEACAERAARDIAFSSRMKNRVFSNTTFGWSTACRVRAVLDAVDRGAVSFARASSGTSTVTYYACGGSTGKLVNLYRAERVAYPRVDADYIPDKPFQLYPHPPLDSLGYKDEYLEPMPEEVPLTLRSTPLLINTMRLMPPASLTSTARVITRLFEDKKDGGLSERDDRAAKEVLDYVRRNVGEDAQNEYRALLSRIYEPLPMLWVSEDEVRRAVEHGELPDFADEIEGKLDELAEQSVWKPVRIELPRPAPVRAAGKPRKKPLEDESGRPERDGDRKQQEQEELNFWKSFWNKIRRGSDVGL